MAKALVTGGAGFIGSSLAEALIKKGIDVIAYDNLSAGTKDNIQHLLQNHCFTFVLGDTLNKTLLEETMMQCDFVFHLAANPDVRVGVNNTSIDYQQNVFATYHILEAMRKSPKCKKIIFTSSSTVYGEPRQIPTPESYSPLAPISLYGAAKLACEAMISGYCNTFDMSGVVLRLANVVGPRTTHGVIFDFVLKLFSDPTSLEILGDGRQTKSYLYISDCINALVHGLEIETTFDIFNAGSKDKIIVTEIAKILIKELSLENVDFKFKNNFDGRGWKGDVKDMLLDSSKLETTGWKRRFDSKESIMLAARGIISRMQNGEKRSGKHVLHFKK